MVADAGDLAPEELLERIIAAGEFYFMTAHSSRDARRNHVMGIGFMVFARGVETWAWYPFIDGTADFELLKCPCGFSTLDPGRIERKSIRGVLEEFCPRCSVNGERSLVTAFMNTAREVQPFDETWAKLRPIFETENVTAWTFDAKVELQFIEPNAGYSVKNRKGDVMLAAYIANENIRNFSLATVAQRILKKEAPTWDLKGSGLLFEKARPLCSVVREQLSLVRLIREKTFASMAKQDPNGRLEKVFWGIEMPFMEILKEMEMTGVAVSYDRLRDLDNRIARQQEEILDKNIRGLTEDWDAEINLKSPQDRVSLLFGKVEDGGLDLPRTNLAVSEATGLPGTGKNDLQHLAGIYPVVADILNWSSLETIRNNYTRKFYDLAKASDDRRVYPVLEQTGTKIGRISCGEPIGFLSLPRAKRISGGPGVRHGVVASDGTVFVSADLSQIELRTIAHLAPEPKMLAIYERETCEEDEGKACESFATWGRCRHTDIHIMTMEDVQAAAPEIEVDRNLGKKLNFGNLYRQGRARFCQSAQLYDEDGIMMLDVAERLIAMWYQIFGGVADYHRRVEREVNTNGWLSVTKAGRRRRLSFEASKDKHRAVTQGIQFAVSGLAQEIMKLGMIKFARARESIIDNAPRSVSSLWKRVKFILQVYDDVVLEAPLEIADEVGLEIKEALEGAVGPEFRPRVVADLKQGPSLGELKRQI